LKRWAFRIFKTAAETYLTWLVYDMSYYIGSARKTTDITVQQLYTMHTTGIAACYQYCSFLRPVNESEK